jgi:hypothetical protein
MRLISFDAVPREHTSNTELRLECHEQDTNGSSFDVPNTCVILIWNLDAKHLLELWNYAVRQLSAIRS